MTNFLLGVSGSVAAIKLPLLIQELQKRESNCNIKVIATKKALGFIDQQQISVEILTDDDEWKIDYKLGDPILHIQLRDWADVFIIAPTSANTLAKLANGMCDNLLTCVARAWKCPCNRIFIAPAMNTRMYEHLITQKQLEALKEFGYQIIDPISKKLACGDVGIGAMENPSQIVDLVLTTMAKHEAFGEI